MKRLLRGAIAILLGVAVGMFAVANVFAPSVHAAVKPPGEIAEVAQELHPDQAQHHDDTSINSQFSPDAVKQRIQTYHDWQNQSGSSSQNPVDAVRASAGSLGLNSNTDTFYLISKTVSIATVHVVHQKRGYNVTLIPSGTGAWIAASISPAQ